MSTNIFHMKSTSKKGGYVSSIASGLVVFTTIISTVVLPIMPTINTALAATDITPTEATINATKIVCDNESDLPNLGGSNHNTDSLTAHHFLNSHPNCHATSDWQFQWGTENATNPGDDLNSPAGGPWTTFGPTNGSGMATAHVTINDDTNSRIWVREVLKPGYLGFSGNADEASNVSAEIYCSIDGLHYDNYDRVDNPVAGHTYDCVAFNTLQPAYPTPYPTPPPTTDVCSNLDGAQGSLPTGYFLV